MRISDILRSKGSEVVTIDPQHTMLDIARVLVEHNIGAAVVEEGGRPVGIVSERDILRLTASGPERLAGTIAGEVMSNELLTSAPGDDVGHVMNLMTRRRVRHLPILDRGRLVGIVSIGDVVNALRTDTEEVNNHLRHYISGTF